jgi:hypothetical protein
VIVRGDGVAAYCCAYLLAKAGFRIDLQPVDRTRLPVILLGDQALALIRDIFEQPKLLASAPRIWKRVVAWGTDDARAVEHSAVIVSEEQLLEALRPRIAPSGDRECDWSIFASRPLPGPVIDHSFGARSATATPVKLKEASDRSACWIEALSDGWLFLTPWWLLSVGASADALLGRSRVVESMIAECGEARGPFSAYPKICAPLGAPGWLACGTAAMAFDPICGDGTAHAVREAILASAVIRAVERGGIVGDLVAHYETRLTAGFGRHLELCRQFYHSGGTGSFWQSEREAAERGIDWCRTALARRGAFRYQLRGLELEAVR